MHEGIDGKSALISSALISLKKVIRMDTQSALKDAKSQVYR